jgi:hypothetical protein
MTKNFKLGKYFAINLKINKLYIFNLKLRN